MNKFTIEQTMTVLMAMDIPADKKLAVHLASHYEHPRLALFSACKQAILLDNFGFDWDATQIKLPEQISFMGQTEATMRNLIEINNLHWFLKDTEDNGRKMSEESFTMNTTTK